MKILTSVFAAAALLVAPVPAMAQRHGGGRGYGGFHGGFHGYGGFRGYGFGGFYYPYWGGFCPVPPFGVDPYPWYYCYPGYYGPAYWGYDGPPPLPRRDGDPNAAPAGNACGHWFWRPEQDRYEWIAVACGPADAPPAKSG